MAEDGKENISQKLDVTNPENCEEHGLTHRIGAETPDKSFGVGISHNCEEISIEGTVLRMSVELSLDTKDSCTVFTGPKAGVRAKNINAKVKAGAFVSGKIQGALWKK